MRLRDNEKGFAVMTNDLSGYSIDGHNINELIPYCRNGDVIVEWLPKVCGFTISVNFYKWYRPMIRKHKNYIHRPGIVVYRSDQQNAKSPAHEQS